MKLLFDQNISFSILQKLAESFPNVAQVRMLDLENSLDRDMWTYTKENDYSIVAFDTDFF